jgi:hypothetical protein
MILNAKAISALKRQRSLQVRNPVTKKAAQNKPVYRIQYFLHENTYISVILAKLLNSENLKFTRA